MSAPGRVGAEGGGGDSGKPHHLSHLLGGSSQTTTACAFRRLCGRTHNGHCENNSLSLSLSPSCGYQSLLRSSVYASH